LKAKAELRGLHPKMNLLLEEQIKILLDSQAEQLALLKKIDEELLSKKS
jgi:hypothetical protein